MDLQFAGVAHVHDGSNDDNNKIQAHLSKSDEYRLNGGVA